ncbi:MAG: HTH domain-containing protein, partial [Proteobacteria bacterium]|nr:HTH domain-containing protein [Pseudomonadota bacterium]
MKGRILNILRAENGIVSGEAISSLLGISRVSIWKHIHKLSESGYDIRSTPTGY